MGVRKGRRVRIMRRRDRGGDREFEVWRRNRETRWKNRKKRSRRRGGVRGGSTGGGAMRGYRWYCRGGGYEGKVR